MFFAIDVHIFFLVLQAFFKFDHDHSDGLEKCADADYNDSRDNSSFQIHHIKPLPVQALNLFNYIAIVFASFKFFAESPQHTQVRPLVPQGLDEPKNICF